MELGPSLVAVPGPSTAPLPSLSFLSRSYSVFSPCTCHDRIHLENLFLVSMVSILAE